MADAYDIKRSLEGLSPEDAAECWQDFLTFGMICIHVGKDGIKRRYPASEYIAQPKERAPTEPAWWETKPRG